MPKQVIVLTPGRSGSSMLAHVLMRLGVFMGDRTRPPDHANPQGYFEDHDFTRLNQRLCANLPHPAPLYHFTNPYLMDNMRALVEKRDSEHDLWGFKDGPQCLTCRLWHPLFSDPHYIYMWREQEAVALSHAKAWGLPVETMRENWQIYTRSAEEFLEDKDYLVLNYHDVLRFPAASVMAIANYLDVPYSHHAQAVIDPAMRTVIV